MNEVVDYPFDDSDPILSSQCNDLIRRCLLGLDSEYRLLWMELENALESYLANKACAMPKRRASIVEVYRWFHVSPDEGRGLFAFPTIWDLPGIDSGVFLEDIESLCVYDVPVPTRLLVSRAYA
jgi:hypothetical protein